MKYRTLIFFLLILISCNPHTRYKVLSVFFDGVPRPGGSELKRTGQQDSTQVRTVQQRKVLRQKLALEQTFHPPFAERDCGACHNMQAGNKLMEDQPDLCFECHDDFRDTLAVLHGPVAQGTCTTCHHPHVAKQKKLLRFKNQELCLFCHLVQDVAQNEAHEDVRQLNCLECHNPHGGDEKPFLN